jgi:N-hydroxyarylamine O-acetyltransferase
MTERELMRGYLERLGFAEPPPSSWATLTQLVERHLQTVPFENLDVVEGLRGELSTPGVLHKLVNRGRGGFCYELNEAFGTLLTHLGFSVRRIEARVWSAPLNTFGPPFDHLALVVSLPQGEFLTDVGFGDNNRTPLRLPTDETEDISGHYTLEKVSESIWRLSRAERPLYDMTLAAQPLEGFAPMYRFHQSSADSIFSKRLICTRATPNGRITLSGDCLSLIEGAHREESVIADRDLTLETHFGIARKSIC